MDGTAKKRWKQSGPRPGHKSSAKTIFNLSNPQSSFAVNSAESEILLDQKITPVITGIQAESPVEKAQHLTAACSIVEDPVCRKLLLKQQIVQLVLDKILGADVQEVVAAGWRLLSKLVLYEGQDLAVHLYRKDIVSQVDNIINSIEAGLKNLAKDPKAMPPAAQNVLWDCALSVMSLLTGMCETTADILKAVSSDSVLGLTTHLLSKSIRVPENVQTATVIFLDRVTDENPLAYLTLVKDSDADNADFVRNLVRFYSGKLDDVLLKTAATCSALHNIIASSIAEDDDFAEENNISDARLIAPLTAITKAVLSKPNPSQEDQHALFLSLETLGDIANQTIETFGHNVPSEANGIKGKSTDSDAEMDIEEDEEEMEEDDEEGEGDEEEEDDDAPSDEELPDELGADMAMVTGEEGTTARASKKKPFNSPELELLIITAVPTVLPITTSTPSTPTENHIKLTAIGLLTSLARAFATLTSKSHKCKYTLPQNLQESYLPVTNQIWDNLVTPILLSNSADLDLAEKITDLSVQITRYNKSVSVSNNQHKAFLALYNAQTPSSLKALCVKVLSNIAQCQGTARVEINKELGTFFISTVNKLPYQGEKIAEDLAAPEVIIESLNAIYDVYADMDYDYDEEVFVKLGFLKYLHSFIGRVRAMAKRIDRRKQFELRESADEALLNLQEFIKYKTKERK